MTGTAKTAAWEKLFARLQEQFPTAVVDRFVGGTHTQRLEDNLVPSLTRAQVTELRAQLAAGDGGELRPNATGKRTAHAPYSSAALALNAFGPWLGGESLLSIAGLTGFSEPLRIEAKLQISNGGGKANLDVLLRGPGKRVIAVESKLTETLDPHAPTKWRPPTASRRCRAF